MAAPVQTSLPLLQEGGARPAPHRPRFAGNHEKRVAGLGRALREAMAPVAGADVAGAAAEGWPVLACVTVPSLALQRLLLREPSWAAGPVAVVEADRPSARLLEVNGVAWRQRVRPGMRYAAGLSLLGSLQAGTVEPSELREAAQLLAARLALRWRGIAHHISWRFLQAAWSQHLGQDRWCECGFGRRRRCTVAK